MCTQHGIDLFFHHREIEACRRRIAGRVAGRRCGRRRCGRRSGRRSGRRCGRRCGRRDGARWRARSTRKARFCIGAVKPTYRPRTGRDGCPGAIVGGVTTLHVIGNTGRDAYGTIRCASSRLRRTFRGVAIIVRSRPWAATARYCLIAAPLHALQAGGAIGGGVAVSLARLAGARGGARRAAKGCQHGKRRGRSRGRCWAGRRIGGRRYRGRCGCGRRRGSTWVNGARIGGGTLSCTLLPRVLTAALAVHGWNHAVAAAKVAGGTVLRGECACRDVAIIVRSRPWAATARHRLVAVSLHALTARRAIGGGVAVSLARLTRTSGGARAGSQRRQRRGL